MLDLKKTDENMIIASAIGSRKIGLKTIKQTFG
jgi:hypothetical protein